MNKNRKSTHHNNQKGNKRKMDSSAKMRILYILVLVLMILSLFARVSRVGRATTGQASRGTAARILVFHHKDENLCEDLTITATGNAVFSDCGNGIEKQYILNSSERAQLQSWLDTYSPVNYDPGSGSATQLYLNGRGNQKASDAEIQQMTDFAATLAAKIGSSS